MPVSSTNLVRVLVASREGMAPCTTHGADDTDRNLVPGISTDAIETMFILSLKARSNYKLRC